MISKRGHELLWIGITGMLIFGSSFAMNIYRAFWGDHTQWWTHQSMRVPIEKTTDNFEVYIGGKLLQKHLMEKTLFSTDNTGKQYPVVAQDITARLNNWAKIKASLLTMTTMSGFGLGVATTLFAMGLVQAVVRGKKSR